MDFVYMKNLMDRLTSWRIPGNSVCIYKDGKQVFSYQSGYSDVERGIKMQGGELFNIYSCSKPATVTAALQLYEQGYFLLSDPLYDYIPEFKEMYVRKGNGELVAAKNPITMRHLFTMTAGLTYDAGTALEKAGKITDGKMNTLAVAKYIAENPLAFHPGEKWNYSLCHDVLAAAVEVISGKRFRDYMRENIFEPLEMKDTFYHLPEGMEHKMAQQYRYVNSEEELTPEQLQSKRQEKEGRVVNAGLDNYLIFGSEYDSGGAGIISTVEDYAKFAAALAGGGKGVNGERILSAGTVDLLRTSQLDDVQSKEFTWPQMHGYGYGLGVKTMINRALSGSPGSYGEFGWGGAAGATILVDPDENLAMFYAHHMLNPHEEYYQPRIRNVLYTCLGY